ncbi:MAG: hypothetical protein ACM3MI_13810 [Clostridiales bacterium]
MKFVFAAVILISFAASLLKADDLKMKDGKIYKNVAIIDSTDNFYSVLFQDGTRAKLRRDLIEEIHWEKVTVNLPLISTAADSSLNPMNRHKEFNFSQKKTTFPNLTLLPITVLAGALAYDFFADATDISKNIDEQKSFLPQIEVYPGNENLRRIKESIDRLESRKKSKRVLGIVSVAVGIANSIIALYPVEVEIAPNQVAVSYRYNF